VLAHPPQPAPASTARHAPSPRPRSSRILALEGFFQSLAQGLGETYLNVLAVWLGASGPLLGLVAAVPTTATALSQAVARRVRPWKGGVRAFILASWLGQSVLLATIGGVALWGVDVGIPLLCVIAAGAFALGGLSVPAWTALVFHTVPRYEVGGFFGLRGTLQQAGVLVAIVAGGALLSFSGAHQATAWGFVAIFGLAGLLRAAGAGLLARAPDAPATAIAPASSEPLRGWLGSRKLRRIALYLWGVHFATNIAVPCFVPYMVRDLGWSYGSIAFMLAVPAVTKLASLRLWGRIADRVGPGPLLRTAGWFVIPSAALWLVAPSPWTILFAQVYGGIAWGAFDIAQASTLVQASRGRAVPIGRLNAIDGGVILAGSMLGGTVLWLVETVRPASSGFHSAIALSTVMRAVPATVLLWRIRDIGRPGWSHLALPLRLWAVRPTRGPSLRPWSELVPQEHDETVRPAEPRLDEPFPADEPLDREPVGCALRGPDR
jgi:MFS family permease